MKKYWIFWVMTLMAAVSAKAQQIVDVHQSGEKIVIEYDIDQPAEFVRVYVSTDGGETYKGPLQYVEGDVRDVPAGYNRSITWDVLREFRTFESDNVKFKLSIKWKEKYYQQTFVTANVAYSNAPQVSFGVSAGQVKRFGWFVSAMTNGGFTGLGNLEECDGSGYLEGGYLPMYSGAITTDRLSVIAGGVMRVAEPICVRVGLGYGARNLCWESADGKWYRNKDYSARGIDLSAGVQAHLNGFVISLEAVTTSFKTMEGKLGVGYAF